MQELFVDVHVWDAVDRRARARAGPPDGAAAPSRNAAAAATQADQPHRGGPA